MEHPEFTTTRELAEAERFRDYGRAGWAVATCIAYPSNVGATVAHAERIQLTPHDLGQAPGIVISLHLPNDPRPTYIARRP